LFFSSAWMFATTAAELDASGALAGSGVHHGPLEAKGTPHEGAPPSVPLEASLGGVVPSA
jgi:hypothetical protein